MTRVSTQKATGQGLCDNTAPLSLLDDVTDVVLAYHPKPKTKAAKKRARRKKRKRKGTNVYNSPNIGLVPKKQKKQESEE